MSRAIAVTGGSGFIGSQVVRTLLEQGASRIVVVDNLLTGRAENLEDVKGPVDFIRADIRDYAAMESAFEGCDAVVHLAAIPSVPRSIEDPEACHDVNINGTFNVYRACVKRGVRRVVFAASSAAYGDTEVLPKTEAMAPRPKSPYAAHKVLGEMYTSVFSECFRFDGVALRFFNVYGPRQDPTSAYSGVLSIFMKCILEERPPTIHGDGEQSRDFTYVEDVAGLVVKAIDASGVSGKVINAGNGNRYTLNEVWQTLKRITGSKVEAVYGPSRAGDVRDSQADTTLAVSLLAHAPRFSLEDGLRLTFDWYKADAAKRVAVR